MPFRITVEKYASNLGEYWTNVYWSAGADLAGAALDADAIVAAERPLYGSWVVITKYRVDDAVPLTDNYKTTNVNLPGTNATAAGEFLPLFCVGRVDFNTQTGRPSRKYLRGTMFEGEVQGMLVLPAAVARLQAYGDAVVAAAGTVDVDGQDFANASASNQVAMRQLRRGSKKKTTP